MSRTRPTTPRRGFLLIVVLVVVMVLSLGAYAFSELMLSHHEAAQLSGRQMQTRALVDSGADAARLFVAQDKLTRADAGGTYDNPDTFQGVLVLDDADPKLRGRYTVLAPSVDAEGYLGGVRYGLEDESSRLNLNALLMIDKQQAGGARQLLMALPGCTQEIADAILDWMDTDTEPREYGCENEYYSTLSPPYACKNGPLDTVEELLLVRGVTPQLLFGLDVNRNGMIDPFEESGSLDLPTSTSSPTFASPTAASSDPLAGLAGSTSGTQPLGSVATEADMARGWSAFLTLYSMERNCNNAGEPRINLNQADMQKLYDSIAAVAPTEWATFIVAYRQNGEFMGESVTTGAPPKDIQLDLTQPGKVRLVQVLDLIGKKTQVTMEGNPEPIVLDSPFVNDPLVMPVYMATMMEHFTVSQSKIIPGRININQAPKTILAGIPGMTEEILAEIINRRDFEPSDDLPHRKSETWILAEGIVTIEQMKLLTPFLTAGGDVFRGQVVGYMEGGGAASRAEVVFDATNPKPRVLFWRDLSHLGRGFALETLGVELAENY